MVLGTGSGGGGDDGTLEGDEPFGLAPAKTAMRHGSLRLREGATNFMFGFQATLRVYGFIMLHR